MTDIREGRSSNVVYNFSGNNLREGRGSSVEINISGKDIRKGRGSSVLCNSTSRFPSGVLRALFLFDGGS